MADRHRANDIMDRRFDVLDRLGAPDLWAEIETREPGRPPVRNPSSVHRALVAGLALAMVAAAIGFAAVAFSHHRSAPSGVTSPIPTVANGEIWARVGGGDGPSYVYRVNPDGSGLTMLFSDGRNPADPPGTMNPEAVGQGYDWTPDGSRVAFEDYAASNSGHALNTAIFAMSPDGSGRVQLTPSGEIDSGPAWSPDGSRIAYASDRSPTASSDPGCEESSLCPSDIYAMSADGSAAVQLTNAPADDSHPDWSPDGTRSAFLSWRSGSTELWVMNADGTGATQLSYVASSTVVGFAWAPDGSSLVFGGDEGVRPWSLYVIAADGAGLRTIAELHQGGFGDLAWRPVLVPPPTG